MFIVCTYSPVGECSDSCGNGRQKYRAQCLVIPGFDMETDCVSYRRCKGKYDKYQHENLGMYKRSDVTHLSWQQAIFTIEKNWIPVIKKTQKTCIHCKQYQICYHSFGSTSCMCIYYFQYKKFKLLFLFAIYFPLHPSCNRLPTMLNVDYLVLVCLGAIIHRSCCK